MESAVFSKKPSTYSVRKKTTASRIGSPTRERGPAKR